MILNDLIAVPITACLIKIIIIITVLGVGTKVLLFCQNAKNLVNMKVYGLWYKKKAFSRYITFDKNLFTFCNNNIRVVWVHNI